MDNRIFELADQLKLLKEVKKEYEAKVKDLTAEIESLDRELSDAMSEAECERFFKSGYFNVFTELDRVAVLSQLEKEAEYDS